MNRIYKYPLAVTDFQTPMVPVGAKPLCVQVQHDRVCLWALVDTDAPKGPYGVRIVGTGHPVEKPDDLTYIDTFQLASGDLVFHVFEERQS